MRSDGGRAPPLIARLLPGLLVAATGVGAGDLLTASFAGARLGPAVAWAVVLGAAMKWTLTDGLARWQLGTGTSLLEGWTRRLRIGWIFLAYLPLWSLAVGTALIRACGVAGHELYPLHAEAEISMRRWGVIHALAGVALARVGGFSFFGRLMAACIGVMVVTVLGCAAVTLPRLDLSTVRAVHPLALRGEALAWTVGLIGGVGGTVTLLSYGYWIREQGRQGTAGLRDCRLDLAAGYGMTALFGLAMIVIASGTPGLNRSDPQVAGLLAASIGAQSGPWAAWAFRVGFWAAVFSSLLGVWQGIPYLFADFWGQMRGWDASRRAAACRAGSLPYSAYLAYQGLAPLWLPSPGLRQVQLVYAVLGALFLPLLAVSLLVLTNRGRWLAAPFRSGPVANALLLVTLAFFGWQGLAALRGAAGG